MLINSAIQSYAAIESPVSRQVPGEGTAVRSDIPPIKEVTGTEQSKNGAPNIISRCRALQWKMRPPQKPQH